MYTPKLKTLTLPNGTVQKIGWILVDEAGEPYKRGEAIPAGESPEQMQELADELNAAP
jgi:hypothetical protein